MTEKSGLMSYVFVTFCYRSVRKKAPEDRSRQDGTLATETDGGRTGKNTQKTRRYETGAFVMGFQMVFARFDRRDYSQRNQSFQEPCWCSLMLWASSLRYFR